MPDMIYFVTHHDSPGPIAGAVAHGRREYRTDLRLLNYRDLFTKRRAPVGHYVFTDFDRLTSYEIQAAAVIARELGLAAPAARVLNRPALILERFALLRRLAVDGHNDFSAYRIDSGELPRRYPVFVRLEDDCQKPDTPLLHSQREFLDAIDALRAAGIPTKRRIAVEYCAEPDANGLFRKYGVFRIGTKIFPHHIFLNSDWYVKHAIRHRSTEDERFVAEVDAYMNSMPHEAEIRRSFDTASIDYGRIDYSIVNGRLQTYEINTNPLVPFRKGPLDPKKDARRILFRQNFFSALGELDTPIAGPAFVSFALPQPALQTFPTRSQRLRAVARKVGVRRWRFGVPPREPEAHGNTPI